MSLWGETVHEQLAFAWPGSTFYSGGAGFVVLVPALVALAVVLAVHGGAAGGGARARVWRGAP